MPVARVQWIDFCRVWTAFFVIVRHTERHGESINFLADLFNFRSLVFFFFLVSGYFTHRAAAGQKLDWARVRRLLPPYLFWALFAAATMMPLYYMGRIGTGDWGWCDLYAWVSALGITSWTYWDYWDIPLWYLRTLMLLALFSPLLQRLPLKAMLGVILFSFAANDVLCFADAHEAEHFGWEGVAALPFRLYESTLALGFYCMGLLIRRYADTGQFSAFMRSYAWIPVLGSLILLPCVYHWHFTPPIRSSALVLLGTTTIMSIGCLCEQYLPRFCRLTAKLAPAAFFIYVSHYLILKCFILGLTGEFRGTMTQEQAYWVPFAIFGICTGVFLMLRRFAPRFIRIFALA